MPFPASPSFNTESVNQGSDRPSVARDQIKGAMDDVIAIIGSRGAANGIASLDAGTKVPVAQLPTNVADRKSVV